MLARIWNLATKELIQLRRNRLLIIFIILGPVLELVMVAYSTSAGITDLPTALVDMDRSQESRALVTAIGNTETLDPQSQLSCPDALTPLLEQGSVTVGIIIPQNFSNDLNNPSSPPPSVQVIVDGSQPAAAETATRSAQGVIASFGERVAAQPAILDQGIVTPIDARVQVRFNEELKESNYTIPSEAGFMLAGITLMVASLGIARERELGTLEQLTVSPLRPVEIVIGKAIPAIILGYIVFLLMLGISILGFDVPMRGSWLLLLFLAAFYLFVELGWGIMASAISASQLQALLLVFVFIMVEVVFSGYAFPVENMPKALQVVANLFPIKHWLIVFRGILLKGAGPSAYWQELVALAGLGIGIMSMTIWLLRRRGFA